MKMKKWLVVLLVLLFPVMALASDFSLSGKGGMYFPIDPQFQQGEHIQLNLSWKNIYAFGSYTMMERRIAGQRAGAFNIMGIGLGLDIPISKNLSIWGQVGYYIPNSELVGSTAGHGWNEWANYQEVHYLYWKKWGAEHNYNTNAYKIYDYEIASGNVGGAVGLNLLQPILKHWDIGLTAGYQLLKFKETFHARYPASPHTSWIETRQDANLSGVIFEVAVTYRF